VIGLLAESPDLQKQLQNNFFPLKKKKLVQEL
jgi:hypothetical protein